MAVCHRHSPFSVQQSLRGVWVVRNGIVAIVAAALLLVGYGVGRASEEDRTAITVKVSSADHELPEGYFSLGEDATVMVKPGTDLYRFLARHRDRIVTVTLSESSTRQLSRLRRD
jgi:hypothetical protein